jgi:hypothetical protein
MVKESLMAVVRTETYEYPEGVEKVIKNAKIIVTEVEVPDAESVLTVEDRLAVLEANIKTVAEAAGIVETDLVSKPHEIIERKG